MDHPAIEVLGHSFNNPCQNALNRVKICEVTGFDGDGNADILWRNSNGDTVIWFIKNDAINSSADLGVIATTWTVASTGDFNGDGRRDIFWRNSNGDVVIWFMNSGTIASTGDLGVVASSWNVAGLAGN